MADLDERLLDQILKLLDVDEARPLASHPKLDLRLHLPPDLLMLSLDEARRGHGLRDLVTQPRHDARLARRIARLVAADDLRKLRRVRDGRFVGEFERSGGGHGRFDERV